MKLFKGIQKTLKKVVAKKLQSKHEKWVQTSPL
jgi:hypothetical protein